MAEVTIGEIAGTPYRSPHLPRPLPRPWGFWATSCWGVTAAALATVAVGVPYVTLMRPAAEELLGQGIDELLTPAFSLALFAALAVGVRIQRWPVRSYLALASPRAGDVVVGIAWVIALWIVEWLVVDVLKFGVEDTQLLLRAYREAAYNGVLPLFCLNTVLIAPIVEEIFFRGFVYRGWSGSALGVTGTILVSSIIFGVVHYEYTWVGMSLCFVSGVLFAWMRWRSGTLVLPMLLHGLTNLCAIVGIAIEAHGS